MTILVALGAAALVLGARSGWPSPLDDGPLDDGPRMGRLRAAAAAVDAACRAGDLEEWQARTTSTHRQRLARQLAIVDRRVDPRTLVELVADEAYADMLLAAPLAGEVRDGRAVVVVPRSRGDGAQLLSFVWDGRRMQLDESTHSRGVRDQRTAQAAVEAVMQRER